jgi:hypothetical protein
MERNCGNGQVYKMVKIKQRLISVSEDFKTQLEDIMKEAEKRRGTKPSFPQLTAELSKKNFSKFMSKVLFR